MKYRFSIVAAVLGLMATSCIKETETSQQDLVQTPITISASYAGSNAKVTYSEEGSTIGATWDAGDKIKVVFNGNVSTLDLTSGAGTASAIFSGTVTGTPSATSMLICYVSDANNPTAVTVNSDGSYTYTSGTFLGQDGTLASAAGCNLYYGVAQYGDGTDVSCSFSVNTSMMKFTVTAPSGVSDGDAATLTYKSGDTEIAKASFTVGTGGTNTIYLSIPAGNYSGAQTVVYTSGGNTRSKTLSATAAHFTAGETYSKTLEFAPIDLSSVDAARTFVDGDILTGTLAECVKLSIADGATVTLDDVTIDPSLDAYHAGITCLGDATIVITGTNTVKGFASYYPGIFIPSGKTLTIEGTGTLNAGSNRYGAPGIGAKGGTNLTDGENCGNITINGGTVVATGGSNASGIGGGPWNSCGTITIANTVTRVQATKGGTYDYVKPIGYGSTAVVFGNATVYNGSAWSPNPMVDGTYGGLTLAVSTTSNTDDTWTLTPAN